MGNTVGIRKEKRLNVRRSSLELFVGQNCGGLHVLDVLWS